MTLPPGSYRIHLQTTRHIDHQQERLPLPSWRSVSEKSSIGFTNCCTPYTQQTTHVITRDRVALGPHGDSQTEAARFLFNRQGPRQPRLHVIRFSAVGPTDIICFLRYLTQQYSEARIYTKVQRGLLSPRETTKTMRKKK